MIHRRRPRVRELAGRVDDLLAQVADELLLNQQVTKQDQVCRDHAHPRPAPFHFCRYPLGVIAAVLARLLGPSLRVSAPPPFHSLDILGPLLGRAGYSPGAPDALTVRLPPGFLARGLALSIRQGIRPLPRRVEFFVRLAVPAVPLRSCFGVSAPPFPRTYPGGLLAALNPARRRAAGGRRPACTSPQNRSLANLTQAGRRHEIKS
jgi:hypothetical protein